MCKGAVFHSTKWAMLRLPHITRLSGEFREFVHSLEAKDMMFRGIFRIMLCYATDDCSSIKSLVKSPCIVSFLSMLFHVSLT